MSSSDRRDLIVEKRLVSDRREISIINGEAHRLEGLGVQN